MFKFLSRRALGLVFLLIVVVGLIFSSFPNAMAFGDEVDVTVEVLATNGSGAVGDGASYDASYSEDGRFLVFVSTSTDLVGIPNPTFGWQQVYRKDLQSGELELLSKSVLSNTAGNGSSGNPRISADGCIVYFSSEASDLIPNDPNDFADVFVWDCSTGEVSRVILPGSGAPNDDIYMVDASTHTDIMLLWSDATNLVENDTNEIEDLFVLKDNQIVRIQGDENPNSISNWEDLTDDGTKVVFDSYATNLGPQDLNGHWLDVYLYDIETGEIFLISRGVDSEGRIVISDMPRISSDGNFIVYRETPTVYPYHSQVWRVNLITEERLLVSAVTPGVPGSNSSGDYGADVNDHGDVVFTSNASNLVDYPVAVGTKLYLWDAARQDVFLLLDATDASGEKIYPEYPQFTSILAPEDVTFGTNSRLQNPPDDNFYIDQYGLTFTFTPDVLPGVKVFIPIVVSNMNTSQNVITIEPGSENGPASGTMFRAPADNQATRALWVFLVENLQPGFIVELSNGVSELTRPSGNQLPLELYAKVMGL